MKNQTSDRRPISARNSQYSQRISTFLAQHGVAPNVISIASVVFALGAGLSLLATSSTFSHRIWWILTAVLIVLRLLANMFDGMVAVETGKASPTGELFNEVPDRISDVVIFVCAGFAAGSSLHLGYITAVLSLFIAYVRALGNHMGVSQLFIGPMAKSHRMFTLAALCIYNAIMPITWQLSSLLTWGLLIISIGGILTIIRRLQRIAKGMAT
ncbi:MAG: CDP-alcohol phosphatidyltransferase family protein [Anaerolineales bacterium]|nr:CDP-alcohol phosphatidyltransferase family protein [Anaerolineales bacterium]